MAAQKRTLDESSSSKKAKKSRTESHQTEQPKATTSSLLTAEVDFPRGGGTSFTPLEVKAIRAEAAKEADDELFHDASNEKKGKKRKRKDGESSKPSKSSEAKETVRIEHLNYKRLSIGMKIFGQIVSILPLALIVSLPNQLYAHVPITNISTQFTELLERADAEEPSESESEDDEDDERPPKDSHPELFDLFTVGQYVRAVVSAVHAPGATDISGIGKARDEISRASKRVELSLIPESVNTGVSKSDLKPGFTLTASVKSREDHGFILDFGLPEISGFVSNKDAAQGKQDDGRKLRVGALVDVTVTKTSPNGRTCTVNINPTSVSTSCLSEISSVTSVLPGTLVQALITAVNSDGLNLQVLGFFDGTIEQLHLDRDPKSYKLGKKVKARVLYEHSTSPPKFALSLAEHVVKMTPRMSPAKEGSDESKTVQETYPVGTKLDSVKVVRLESERGMIVEVAEGVEGFIHISHVSDDHVPSLSASGPWKVGSLHPARVTGYFAFDGLLQLSLKPSVIEQKYLQIGDIEVGEVIKGTIKKLTPSGLFVNLAGGIDGVVWPNHYADIVLKHPAKRFKDGASIKCRVLAVDPERKRVALTAKKTLLDSSLPILCKPEDVSVGVVTHAVVFKIYEKNLLVEFYNNMKAIIPAKEISETPKAHLSEAFPIGKVVKVRVLANDDGRITASIKQAAASFDVVTDISSVEIGNTVDGTVTEIHKDNVVLTLQPSHVRALLSIKNLANHRGLAVPQLRVALKVGEKLDELVVVTRNVEKSIVIVANKPKTKPAALPKGTTITMESLTVGQLIGGRVTRHTRHGALIKITSHIGGILHLTDLSDNFEVGSSLPAVDTVIKAVVIAIDESKRQVTLSTRASRMYPDKVHEVRDREIADLADVQVGQPIRGFVKNVVEHGLFVTVGREVDARIQIRELFDEYVKDWQSRFTPQQLVSGRVISVDIPNKKAEMSLRSLEAMQRKSASGVTLSDLKAGMKVDGSVKKIEDYGLFIQIEGSKLTGLCHKSQLSDNTEADVAGALRGFREGDRVKAFVLGIDNRRISLSLKPSHFSAEDLEESDDEDAEVDGEDDNASGSDEEVDDDDQEEELEEGDDDDDLEDAVEEDQASSDDEMDIDLDQNLIEQMSKLASSKPATKAAAPVTTSLSLAGGFQWSGEAQASDEDMESSSDEDESEQPSRKKRKKKQIEHDLTADLQTKTPDSNADFERLLLGSPNSSYLWIQYMSFQLPLSEVDKAREIARRAIRTINFREEKERLNVWIALLNLENVYGTDESLDAVFKEAARANDSKTIHLRLASIFDQSNKPEKCEEQYKRTCKKFGQSSKVWSLFGEFQLRRGNVEEARKLLPRSLQSLEKRKHLKTISRFAQLEYKYGDAERGKTLFEGIIDSHPKRWDMWSVYMDMEASQNNIQSLRNLFERVLALKMTSHKAKSFFKKWLDLEKKIGDEEGVEVVKQKAVEWTQRAANLS